jgi:hypothetical protein
MAIGLHESKEVDCQGVPGKYILLGFAAENKKFL